MEITPSIENVSSGNYIAFFDLDQTIIKTISGREFARQTVKEGRLSVFNLLKVLLISLAFKLNIIDPLKIIDEMIGWIKGMPVDTMDRLSSIVFHNALVPSIYTEVKNEIKFHKDKNARVVILSSSIAPVCSRMADHLEIDDVICSKLEVMDGKYTGQPLGPLCYGSEKPRKLKEYCKKYNLAPDTAWYYGDSISDLPVLSIVGTPVCINPDKKLLKFAVTKGWRICNWH